MVPAYQEYGYYSSANGLTPQVLAAGGYPNEANEDALMNQYIADAQSTGNVTLALKYYAQAEVLTVNLTFYIYTQQANSFWFYSTSLKGMQFEQNPMYGGDNFVIYIYLSK